VVLEKTLSTPDDPSRAVMTGLEQLAAREGQSLHDFLACVDAIVHATTIGDNTLIEQKGAVTGLLTTTGFRDELELRRGYKEDIWDVRLPAPPAIVPRRRRLGVPERLRFDGSVALPLDEAAARVAIERLARERVESVAIALLFSFVNPVHERRLAELVAEIMPGVPISLSHEVMPKAPEFERTSTTVVNAYIGPRLTGYLDRLSERLRTAGFARELLVMQSSGGVMTREYLRAAPVRSLASGPAGGVIGAARFGVSKGAPDLLCVDMGGTSYDVSVVQGGEAPAQPGWNWHHRYVVGLPMVSVETLGAGGGSLCDARGGVLRVGPASAGADPGPVCYGRGGAQPTITDAMLVLGLLSDQSEFAGGSFRLIRKGVDDAFQTHVAGPLGRSVEDAAFDCWRVVNANMTQAVRRWTALRGIDPRTLAMVAYGGNGPLFAAIQAQDLGIERVFVPKTSPAFSALGALAASPSVDEERSYLVSAHQADIARLRALFEELSERARRFLGSAGFADDAITERPQINLRYPGQNWSLAIDVDLAGDGDALLERVVASFHRRHEREYGHARLAEAPELTGVRLLSSVEAPKPEFASGFTATPRDVAPIATRRANLGRGFENVAIHRGASLAPGDRV
ncbi:MAG: hydantoinase/oxoprolinase family protein, partial [Proteobacteria bacterium]|nr:hydantoinase/oxoprolinase family protein [Pseudomonadota bacterium]